MAKPRRSTSEAFYDVFADMPLADQAAALKILEQVHRLAVRESKRTVVGPASETKIDLVSLLPSEEQS